MTPQSPRQAASERWARRSARAAIDSTAPLDACPEESLGADDLQAIKRRLDELTRKADLHDRRAVPARADRRDPLDVLAVQIGQCVHRAGGDCEIDPPVDLPLGTPDQSQIETFRAGLAAVGYLLSSIAQSHDREWHQLDHDAIRRRGAASLQRGRRVEPLGDLLANVTDRRGRTGPEVLHLKAIDRAVPHHESPLTSCYAGPSREVVPRERWATGAETAALKRRLQALSRRLDAQSSERASGHDDLHQQIDVLSRDADRLPLTASALGEIRQRIDALALALDQHQIQMLDRSVAVMCDEIDEAAARPRQPSPTEQLEQWIARLPRDLVRTAPSAEPEPVTAVDPISAPPEESPAKPAPTTEPAPDPTGSPPWSPWAKAGLVSLLLAATVTAGTYLTLLRMSDLPAIVPPIAGLQSSAPFATPIVSRPAAEPPQRAAARPRDPMLPLPDVYGVYAVSGGQLIELEALPGRAPDPRVMMSGAISRPSRTTLPDGRVVFIVFRHDLSIHSAERAQVRVVAKVARAMAFDAAGKPRSLPIDDTWTIRNIAYNFRTAPVDDNPDMLLLRPQEAAFTLPPGRYALVLKGQAFDFTVDGPITEPTQCLERVDAVNGRFYHECQ